MKLQRFIVNFNLNKPIIVFSDQNSIKQIRKVLRLKVGDKIIVSNGKEKEVEGRIIDIGKVIKVKLLEEKQNNNEPEKKVSLYCAILKRENFELVVQKATEVGVIKIIPIITDRTVKLGLNLERLRVIIKEASEQSGRGILPEICEPVKFDEVLADLEGENLFVDFGGVELKNIKEKGNILNIFIGPEGGWTEKERKTAEENKFNIVSLGKLTLRGETAAIVTSYLAVNF